MIDWAELTLFIYINARVSGFILFNPILGRANVTNIVRGGLVLLLSVFVISTISQPMTVPVPGTVIELAVRIILELAVGFLLGLVMNFFFYIPQLAGEVIDTQMGMTMAQTYDAGSMATMSVTGRILNLLMTLLFFAANGHHTLMRILLTSGQFVPFGGAALTDEALNATLQIFLECTILGVKLSTPILAAELIGQIGMGILMKVIPQINVFAINIELKVIIGLLLLLLMISPFSEFLLQAEAAMLDSMGRVLDLTG